MLDGDRPARRRLMPVSSAPPPKPSAHAPALSTRRRSTTPEHGELLWRLARHEQRIAAVADIKVLHVMLAPSITSYAAPAPRLPARPY